MITYPRFQALLSDVADCTSLEEYIAECGGAVPVDTAEEALRILNAIWIMAHAGLTFRSIADACGLSMLSLCKHLDISRRTAENWAAGIHNPPAWQMPLIAYAAVSLTTQE